MFPLKDNIPARVFPVVNITLIAVNLVIFVYVAGQGDSAVRFLDAYGFVPARFLADTDFFFLPGKLLPVFSSMFLHGSVWHLFGNMWILWIFGDNVEDAMGHGRYLLFYLFCGLAAVLAQAMAAPVSLGTMVGASGAISGVLGAYFRLYPGARVLTLLPLFVFFYLVEVPAYFFLGVWFLLQFVQGWAQYSSDAAVTGGVAWWAHVGGFGAGLFLVRFFGKSPSGKQGGRRLRL